MVRYRLSETPMSFDPFGYEREEERDSERFYFGPDPALDPSEYQEYLSLEKRLDCGHTVAASEDSGGMDELDRVTVGDVERLLAFKVASHSCERFEKAIARRWGL